MSVTLSKLGDLIELATVAESKGDLEASAKTHLEVRVFLMLKIVQLCMDALKTVTVHRDTLLEYANLSLDKVEQLRAKSKPTQPPAPPLHDEKVYENPIAAGQDKGFENPTGANNCFLNVVLQSL